MKMLKWALLGGAAFAVTATAAKADELSDLKAQLEQLQTRVTQLESQPATSLPSGYSLMTFRSGGAVYDAVPEKADMRELTDVENGFTIGVMPTADVAPVAEVTVSGEIRTILVYDGNDDLRFRIRANFYDEDGEEFIFTDNVKVTGSDDDKLDVSARGRLVVTGKSETAVGEVGGRIRIQAGGRFNGGLGDDAIMNQAYAWWKFSPSWQLIAGLWDSTSAVQAGIDWDFTGPAFTGLLGDDGRTEQMRLVFNSGGPMTFAIALEDSDEDSFSTFANLATAGYTTGGCFNNVFINEAICYRPHNGDDIGDVPSVAGYIAYDSEGVFLQLTGLWEQDERGFTLFTNTDGASVAFSGDFDDNWFVGAGARFGLGDVATFTAAGFYGEGYQDAVYTLIAPDDQYWGATAGIIANVGEASRVEIGGAYFRNKDAFVGFLENQWAATAGWYWEPVSQVTLFLNGSYAWNEYQGLCLTDGDNCSDLDNQFIQIGNVEQNDWQVNFGTYLRF
jgi:hypothetical protein